MKKLILGLALFTLGNSFILAESTREIDKKEKQAEDQQNKLHPERKGFIDAKKRCEELYKDESPLKVKECLQEYLKTIKK